MKDKTNNLVAKYARKYNKAAVHKDRKKAMKKGERKHKGNMDEKLSTKDDAGKWVMDFRKSDAPQFVGKSDEKKQKMAIAAYLSAKDDAKKDKEEGVIAPAGAVVMGVSAAARALKVARARRQRAAAIRSSQETNEDLRKWFGKGKKGDWVRVGTDGDIKGDCAREPGEGKPKCMPRDKAHSMSKKDRGSAAQRKRAKDPTVDRPGTGNKPIMVKTDKKESVQEKNEPTNPKLWAKFKAQAKSKFDVYPSAYANGWAAKQYKAAGGGWKTVKEDNDPCWDTHKKVGTKMKNGKVVNNCVPKNEEVVSENRNLIKDYQALKSKGKKDSAAIDILMSMPKYKRMTSDQMSKIIGDAKRKGIIKEGTINEMAMPRKEFEKLKKGDKLKFTFDSSMKKGHEVSLVVTGKSRSAKYDVEKVNMKDAGDPRNRTKFTLYSRKGGDATLAWGDAATVMQKYVKESAQDRLSARADKHGLGKPNKAADNYMAKMKAKHGEKGVADMKAAGQARIDAWRKAQQQKEAAASGAAGIEFGPRPAAKKPVKVRTADGKTKVRLQPAHHGADRQESVDHLQERPDGYGNTTYTTPAMRKKALQNPKVAKRVADVQKREKERKAGMSISQKFSLRKRQRAGQTKRFMSNNDRADAKAQKAGIQFEQTVNELTKRDQEMMAKRKQANLVKRGKAKPAPKTAKKKPEANINTVANKQGQDDNLIMQLRKAQDKRGKMKVKFRGGETQLPLKLIDRLLATYDKAQRPQEKKKLVNMITHELRKRAGLKATGKASTSDKAMNAFQNRKGIRPPKSKGRKGPTDKELQDIERGK